MLPVDGVLTTIHWMMAIITQLWMSPQLELIFWFHLGNQFCEEIGLKSK
jgi:hypothetical protein